MQEYNNMGIILIVFLIGLYMIALLKLYPYKTK